VRKSFVIPWLKAIPSGITAEFGQVAYLNSNHINNSSFIALGVLDELSLPNGFQGDPFQAFQTFIDESNDWIFGYFTYELKDYVENLQSHNRDELNFPLLRFFRPEFVGIITGEQLELFYHEHHSSPERLEHLKLLFSRREKELSIPEINFMPAITKEQYLADVKAVKHQIQLGEIYEMNYCMAYEANIYALNVNELYERLNNLSEAPFSVFYEDDTHAVLSASPERYLRKTGKTIISQPIKGTRARKLGIEDEVVKAQLRNDPKEIAENMMITDLVRNDLSKISAPQSVIVDELLGLYSFKTVHQLITTIRATLKDGVEMAEILRATFPMGSMTGAPKIRAMQLIEKFEHRRRGLYSGAFGYITPNGDFDFNVVIRSLLYNKQNGHLAFQVGSAITALSDAAAEYEECLVKAEALLRSTKSKGHVRAV
jgi:para-aminobenzoate synthetase component I